MHKFGLPASRFAAALGLSMLLAQPAAVLAGSNDPGVSALLERVNDQVTYSRPATNKDQSLTTYAAYKLTIFNKTTNKLSRLYVNAEALNLGGVGTDPVTFDSLAGIPADQSCPVTEFGKTKLNCETKLSIEPGGESSFIIVVKAPKNGGPIQITGTAGGHEGNGEGNGCCAVPFDPVETTLIDPTTNGTYTTNATSFIKNSGNQKLFTGDRWTTTTTDPITTLVLIPAFSSAPYDIGILAEDDNNVQECTTQAHFTKCYKSAITLDDIDYSVPSGPPTNFLTIVLRVDSSVIAGGTKIEDVKVMYTDESGTSERSMCGSTFPEDYPCIVDRRILKNQNSLNDLTSLGLFWTNDLKGDFQWVLKHYKNGSWALF